MEVNKKETKLLKMVEKMKEPYKSFGLRIHKIIMEINPKLEPASMYGMPAYKHHKTSLSSSLQLF